jgi:hypothetical protein
MDTLREKLLQELDQYYANPGSIQQVALDILEEAVDGNINIVDPSSPFMFLLEASATNTSTAILKAQSVMRRLYPMLATNYAELYHHMADEDYLDRFATPSRTTLTLVVPVESVKTAAVMDTQAGVRRLTIPKDTVFRVGGIDWFVHYPIEITVTPTNVIQVSYDLAPFSPLLPKDANALDYRTVQSVNGDELVIDLPVEQVSVVSHTTPMSPSTGFSALYPITDQFYYVRAYWREESGVWNEMSTTHTDQVFDTTRPTMIVNVEDRAVRLTIPDIYTTQNMVGDHIRVDLFTTKGKVNIDLQDFSSADFSGRWQDLNGTSSTYVQALQSLTDIQLYALADVVSGRDGLSFEALRDRVIYRSADKRASITFEELAYEVRDKGYTLSKAKDTITERLYTCARPLPAPVDNAVSTPIGVKHSRVALWSGNGQYSYSLARNGDRVTLTNRALLHEANGTLSLLKDSELDALASLSPDQLIGRLNEGNLFYNPFFYVVESNVDVYQARPYYLDNPRSISRSFIDNNKSIWFAVNTRRVDCIREENQYHITMRVDIPNGLTGLHGQLTVTDVSGQEYHVESTETTYEGKVAYVRFTLETSFDIDADDRIEITNLKTEGGVITNVLVDLESDVEVFYYKESTLTEVTDFDYRIYPTLVGNWVAATHERHRIRLGDSLEGLSCRAEAIISTPTYRRYEEDVVMRYETPVYERDDEGNLVWAVDVATGKPVFNVLHDAGDPVTDDEGSSVLLHRAGDVMLDSMGDPIIDEPADIIWELTMMALDARYRYAQSVPAERYRNSIGPQVLAFLTQDLRALEPRLMARTELEYLPNASVGIALATVESKQDVFLDTALGFTINYIMSEVGYADSALRTQVVEATHEALRATLYRRTFSLSELTRALQAISDHIVSVSIENPIDGYSMAKLVSENAYFSLRAELYQRTNGVLDIRDAVEVNFLSI